MYYGTFIKRVQPHSNKQHNKRSFVLQWRSHQKDTVPVSNNEMEVISCAMAPSLKMFNTISIHNIMELVRRAMSFLLKEQRPNCKQPNENILLCILWHLRSMYRWKFFFKYFLVWLQFLKYAFSILFLTKYA